MLYYYSVLQPSASSYLRGFIELSQLVVGTRLSLDTKEMKTNKSTITLASLDSIYTVKSIPTSVSELFDIEVP
jgi:hypothetical protein